MKITKEELKKIIREELKSAMNEDTASAEQVAKAAKQLGYMLGGQPPTAAAVRDALKGRFPQAAEALYSAYEEAQNELDLIYSGYDQ